MSTDPTRLYVFNEAAESYDSDTPGMNLDEDELAFVRDLFSENGRYVSETSYDSTIVSDVFVTSDENMEVIDEIEAALRDHYPDREIERDQDRSDQAPSSEGLPYVIGIHIKPTQEEREKRKEARKSQRQNWEDREWSWQDSDTQQTGRSSSLGRDNDDDTEEKQTNQSCPECESESIVTADDGEVICEDCGYIIEIENKEQTDASPQWRAFDTDESIDRYGSDLNETDVDLSSTSETDQEVTDPSTTQGFGDIPELEIDWSALGGPVSDQMTSFLVVQLDESPVLVLFEKETGKVKTTIELTTTSDGESLGDSEDQNSDLSSNDRHTNEAAEERSAPDSEWEPKRGVHWCTGDEAVFTVDAYGARRYDNGDEDPSWCTGEEMFGDATKQSVCAYLDGMLFVATEDVVAVIRATDGTVRCSRELDVSETTDLRLLIASERLYVSEGDRIIAIDVSTGAELWTHAPGDEHRSQTVQKFVDIVEGVVVTIERSDTQYVCGYDAETGTRRWAFQDRRSLTVEGVHDGTVYLDGGEGVLLALSVATGVLRWDHQFRKLTIPPDDYKRRARPDRSSINYLTLTDHGIVTSNWSGGIYLLDPATGEKEWEVYPEDPDAGPEAACRVVEDTVVRIKDTQIEGFDLDSGDQQWSFESGDLVPTDTQWGLPVASDDRLYCVDYEGVLYEIGSDGLTRIFRPDRETAHEFALDSERVYLAPHNMDTGIPAYRKAQMADADSESDQDDPKLLAVKR